MGIFSRIAAILIKGQIVGTALAGDSFGIVAQRIGSFTTGKAKLPLTADPNGPFMLSFPTLDVVVREL